MCHCVVSVSVTRFSIPACVHCNDQRCNARRNHNKCTPRETHTHSSSPHTHTASPLPPSSARVAQVSDRTEPVMQQDERGRTSSSHHVGESTSNSRNKKLKVTHRNRTRHITYNTRTAPCGGTQPSGSLNSITYSVPGTSSRGTKSRARSSSSFSRPGCAGPSSAVSSQQFDLGWVT